MATKARGTAPRTTRPRKRRTQPKGTRGSGVQTVYTSLKQDILEMSLAPGAVLDEVSLSERFSMSRTPIREALVRLAGDGLVATLPNRNTIVSMINFAELPVYFEALTLMYRVSTRAAASRRKPADLDKMRLHQDEFTEAVRQQDALRMIASNREFHVAIAEAGGNKYYTAFFARLLDEGRRILRLYYASFDDRLPKQYVNEHERIIAAIEARDAELCDELATQHAAQIVKQIQSFLDRGMAAEISLAPARIEAAVS
jgi:DNA-binding GntR family transcriptional regulator